MWSMFFSQSICFILYNHVYCGIIGLWWAFPSWKRKPTANLELCLACYKLKNECGFRISDMWSAGKLERFYKLVWRQIWTGEYKDWVFSIPLMSLNCNLFMSEQFSRNNRVQAWCVFSIHDAIAIASLLHEVLLSEWGGVGFRGSTRRICCTSQDLHLHLHVFFFFCVRRIRACNSWSQQIAGAEKSQPPAAAAAAESCNRRDFKKRALFHPSSIFVWKLQ